MNRCREKTDLSGCSRLAFLRLLGTWLGLLFLQPGMFLSSPDVAGRAGSSPATRACAHLFTCGIAEVDLCRLRSWGVYLDRVPQAPRPKMRSCAGIQRVWGLLGFRCDCIRCSFTGAADMKLRRTELMKAAGVIKSVCAEQPPLKVSDGTFALCLYMLRCHYETSQLPSNGVRCHNKALSHLCWPWPLPRRPELRVRRGRARLILGSGRADRC